MKPLLLCAAGRRSLRQREMKVKANVPRLGQEKLRGWLSRGILTCSGFLLQPTRWDRG